MAPRTKSAIAPGRLFAAVWVLGGPLLLATLFDHSAAPTFQQLALAGAALLLFAAVCGAGLSEASAARRRVVAACAFSAMLGAGFLVLDRAGFLLSLGL